MTAAEPDPRFRDQIAKALETMLTGATGIATRGYWQRRADALLPMIAAEVDAQVQAAANQQAEDLEALARRFEHLARHHHGQAADTQPVKALSAKHRGLAVAYTAAAEDLAAALTSPAPAPRAEATP